MKILYIYKYFTYGGVEAVLYNRYIGMKKISEDIEIGAIFLYKYVNQQVKIVDNIYFTSEPVEIKEILDNYDKIIVIDTPEVFDLLENSNKHFILEIHTSYKKERAYIKRNLPSVLDFIITPSRSFSELVKSEISNKNIPVYYVYNPVNENFFDHSGPKLKIDNFRPVLWIGRLDSLKNWEEALYIFSGLINRFDDIELILVGRTFDVDDMLEKIERHELLAHVRYIPGLDFLRMPALYRAVFENRGVYLSTSRGESFGMTLAESMAAGIPSIVPDMDVFKEISQENAEFYKVKEEAVNMVARFFEDEIYYEKKSRELKDLTQRYSPKSIALKYLELLNM